MKTISTMADHGALREAIREVTVQPGRWAYLAEDVRQVIVHLRRLEERLQRGVLPASELKEEEAAALVVMQQTAEEIRATHKQCPKCGGLTQGIYNCGECGAEMQGKRKK